MGAYGHARTLISGGVRRLACRPRHNVRDRAN
jgi:hypothetical protein